MSVFTATLSDHAHYISQNMDSFREAFPQFASCAETVHQTFYALLNSYIKPHHDKYSEKVAALMAAGAHAGWIQSYVLVSSGHAEAGLANLRRAIEYACYSAKVIGNDKRALAWAHQRRDETARRQFANECSIPLTYDVAKYAHLRPLLVAYATASYMGSHGNISVIALKDTVIDEQSILYSYQDRRDLTVSISGYVILIGYRLLQSFREILVPMLEDAEGLVGLMELLSRNIKEFLISLARIEYGDMVPDHVRRVIIEDDKSEIDRMFAESVNSEKTRKKPQSSS